jgi:peptidoglycan/xylan/chitin deacetylase (PgdA/CDA1 family)
MSLVGAALGKGARRWGASVSPIPPAHARTARQVASLLATVAVVFALAASLSNRGSAAPGALGSQRLVDGPRALAGPLLSGGAPSAPEHGLYRVAGCASRGTGAYRHGPQRREVAFGFDDGPYPDTRAFVRMLASNHVRATFFMIGRQVTPAYRQTILDELREGDVPGDHTFTHPPLTALRQSEVRSQLQRTISVIRALSGYTPCVFRPPYGDVDAQVERTARSLGLATVLWNVDPSDYEQPGVATIERRVLEEAQPGSIVISHDGGGPRGQTLAAYPKIIAALRRRGYEIVTILQLLGFRPVYVPCVRLCDGIGVPRSAVPREAIIRRAA